MHGIHIEQGKGVAKEFQMGNITVETRKARGLCVKCGEVPPMRGYTKCFNCARENALYLERRRLQNRAKRKTRTGKLGIVKMSLRDLKELRWAVFERSGGKCEIIWDGGLCPNTFGWSNFNLHHDPRGSSRSDTLETTRAACIPCHKKLHLGPQWSKRIA